MGVVMGADDAGDGDGGVAAEEYVDAAFGAAAGADDDVAGNQDPARQD